MNLRRRIFIAAYLAAAAPLLVSCVPVYHPSVPSPALPSRVGEIAVGGSFESNGFAAHLAAAPIGPCVIEASGSLSPFSSDNNAASGEIGAGLFIHPTQSGRAEALIGYGGGWSRSTTFSPALFSPALLNDPIRASAHTDRLFLRFSGGGQWDPILLAGTLQLTQVWVSSFQSTIRPRVSSPRNGAFLEAAITLRDALGAGFAVEATYGDAFPLQNDLAFNYDYKILGFGLRWTGDWPW
jgi:hypothetical protein